MKNSRKNNKILLMGKEILEAEEKQKLRGGGIMLEKVDLSKKLEKEEYKEMIDPLRLRLGDLQRRAKEKRIPVIIIFEGWDAAGKGTLINELILALDPRGFNVYSTTAPDEEEKMRPYFWRFWIKSPQRGRIAIFDRSWYTRILGDKVTQLISDKQLDEAFHEIPAFERQLSDDGALIIKFFLHISKKEQKERLEKQQADPAMAWRVTEEDWQHHKTYDAYLQAVEEMTQKTDTSYAPWTIVEAHDKRYAIAKILRIVTQSLEEKLAGLEAADHSGRTNVKVACSGGNDLKVFSSSILTEVDLTKTISDEEYQDKLKKYQNRIRDLEYLLYRKRLPVVVMFEGWDAGGKGGAIRRLTQNMDPRGYTVIPVGAPTDEEKAHHYLWRFWKHMPKAGHIAIFDRSWYGRVLVERVEGFCPEYEWKRSYKEINEMEEQWIHFGAVLVKFWLHIDKDEQLRRFEERQRTPEKQWKITDEDWRNREKWDLYENAVDEMFFRTSTLYAPWTIVEANSKNCARIKVLQTVIEAIEKKL